MLTTYAPTSGFNALVAARHGLFLYNQHDSYIGKSLAKYGEWSEGEIALFGQLVEAGDIVVEVGSNIGSHTVPLARRLGSSGRLYAFEPQRIIYQNLCANIALNSLTNVEAYQVALGETDGQILIPDINYTVDGNYGAVNLEQFKQGQPVRLATLDQALNLPRLKLLKVDVEGMEAAMVRGARATIAKHLPYLYVENDRVEKSAELIELIQSFGYRLYWHLPQIFNPDNFAKDADNIFGNTASFNMFCVPFDCPRAITGMVEIKDPNFHPLRRPEA